MKEKDISAEESFEIIQRMIALSRDKLSQTGFHFILWGILVAFASLLQYFMNTQNWFTFPSYWVWPVITLIGTPIAFIYEFRKGKSGRAKSKSDTIYVFLWLGFAVTLITTIIISVVSQVQPVPFVLSVTGLAVFVSGIIYRFTPLVLGALVFWIAAICCPLLNANDQLLLNSVALILGYIIPGILVGRKYVSKA